ncbi:MAG: methylenetetrahydrofolate reductase [NAD(P)H] [bacterium]
MTKLNEIYNSEKLAISFEIFPPKIGKPEDEDKIKILFEELKVLSKFDPSFISVTYGAGGSTRKKTLELVHKIKDELNIQAVPHFTCVNTTKEETLQYLESVQNMGIENIFALRGDPPCGEKIFQKIENGFFYASELVEFIKVHTNLGIAVAGYPEGHQECKCLDIDINNLKKKVNAGADLIITQLFYDNELFFKFLEKTSEKGINIPIIPGILPIINFNQIDKIISLCSATLPEAFKKELEKYKDDNEAIKNIGIEFAVKQCEELVKNNVSGIHFYTFNKSFAVKSILEKILNSAF